MVAQPTHNLFTARFGGDKTYWHKIGVAWPTKKGNGYNLSFNSLPLPDSEGRVTVFMFEESDTDGLGADDVPF